MPSSNLHFFPLAHPFLLALALLVVVLIALIEVGILRYAYEKMGVDRRYVFGVLLLTLLGSYVNLPVAELPAERVVSGQEVFYFGMRYVIPHVEEWPRTVIAVPTFIPPIVAAAVALILSRQSAPALAYISGSMGTLIGADLLHLGAVQGLGAPIVSIGGAGTFDGIFLTGLLAVLLA